MEGLLSRPALLASIAYLIMAFIIVLPLGMDSKSEGRGGYNLGKRIIIVCVMLIPIALSIYSINCMVVGGCTVWAWVQGIAIAFWVLLFVIASLMANEPTDPVDIINTENLI